MTTETSNARGETYTFDMIEEAWGDAVPLTKPYFDRFRARLETLRQSAPPPPAAARGDVRGLVAKWRERVPEGAGDSARVLMREHCADELESALAAEGVQAGEVEAEEAAHMRTIEQRDAAEDALSRMYRAVTGRDPEWSSAWGFVDAVEEVEEHVAALSQQPEARGVVDVCPKCGAPAEVTEHAGAFEITEEYRYIGMSDAEVVAVPRWFMEKLGRDLADIDMPAMSKSIAALTGERNG